MVIGRVGYRNNLRANQSQSGRASDSRRFDDTDHAMSSSAHSINETSSVELRSLIHLSPMGRGREPTGPARSGRPDDKLRERVRGLGNFISSSPPPDPNPPPNEEAEFVVE